MKFKLDQLEYQQQAIKSVVSLFKGQIRNTFDNACSDGIRANLLTLSENQIKENMKDMLTENGLNEETDKVQEPTDFCIEMETGTGKTLVYLKTIYELYKEYSFTKFIILVPSVATKEGVLKTLSTFGQQFEEIYNIKLDYFEYDSKRLSKVINFIEEQHPQIMVMTLQSFNTDDNILNRSDRENLFANLPYIEAISRTNPIVIMDEPQEGMDTDNSIARLNKINPMVKIRYSATHKVLWNLIYRLTPYDSYQQGLVKKIEVLTVSEKNDEASMKIELVEIILGKGEPKAKLKVWREMGGNFEFRNTRQLGVNASLHEETKNSIYEDYVIEKIVKPITGGAGYVQFDNGVKITQGSLAKNCSLIFNEQLYWLIYRHFEKKKVLKKKGVKCLSLIFIDRVDNYIQPDGIIRKAFIEQYKKIHDEHKELCDNKEATDEQVSSCQGYYFARTGRGDFTDNLNSMANNKELFNLILKDKETLLSFDNPVEFIFSHSALGVGWDNPNVFNIATLNQSYSEVKKRQEIGRGLRICVNQQGERHRDADFVPEGEEVNLLTVIPNETYDTFVSQYQSEIKDIYGTSDAGAETRGNHKGRNTTERQIYRNDKHFNSPPFLEFWRRLALKTEYLVLFDEQEIINKSVNAINEITVPNPQIRIESGRVISLSEEEVSTGDFRSDSKQVPSNFSPMDIVNEISEHTPLSYQAALNIVQKINNKRELVKNPPRFLQEAIKKIRNIQLDEMLRVIEYQVTEETFDLNQFQRSIARNTGKLEPTPNKGIYDHIVWDSEHEQHFARNAEFDGEVVCFLKLPSFYVIDTPIGKYNPDFGLVLKRNTMLENYQNSFKSREVSDDLKNEYYIVIEIKGTNDLNDRHSMRESEAYKIKCACKHFEALGIETKLNYIAPVKNFIEFKKRVEATVSV